MISYFIFFDEKTRYIFLQRPILLGDCWPPRLFLHIDLAIPLAEGSLVSAVVHGWAAVPARQSAVGFWLCG